MIGTQACKCGQDDRLKLKQNVWFNWCAIIFNARQDGMSFSETADLMRFSCTTITWV